MPKKRKKPTRRIEMEPMEIKARDKKKKRRKKKKKEDLLDSLKGTPGDPNTETGV